MRKLLNFTVDECGAALGIAGRTYYNLERGVQRPYLDQVMTLSTLFKVDVSMLVRELTLDERVGLIPRGEQRRAARERAKELGMELQAILDMEGWVAEPAPSPAAAPAPAAARSKPAAAEQPRYKPHQAPQPSDLIEGQEWKWRSYAGLPCEDPGEEQYRAKMRASGNWQPNEEAAALAKTNLDAMLAGAEPQVKDEALEVLLADWQD